MKCELKIAQKANITISSDNQILDQLKEESEKKDLSLNTLINQILRMHVDWYSNASKAGFLPIRRVTIKKLLERYTEDELYKIGLDVAEETHKDIMLLMRDKYDLESAFHVMDSWMKASDYPYRHTVTSGLHKIVIHHDVNSKWSRYISGVLVGVFGLFGVKDMQFDHTQCILSCMINIPF